MSVKAPVAAFPSEPAAGEAAPTCDQCGARLVGRYCHLCGEDNAPPVRTMRAMAEDFLDSVLSYTSQMPITYVALFTRPTKLLEALRSGDMRRYLPAFKLYVTATVLFFLFLSVSGVTILVAQVKRTGPGPPMVVVEHGELKAVRNFRIEERWLHRMDAVPRDAEAVAALDAALNGQVEDVTRAYLTLVRDVADDPRDINAEIATWAPRILWLMMPLYALLLWPFFGRGRLLSEHVIFALWAHSLVFLVLIAASVWNLLGLRFGLAVALIVYQTYLTVGLKGYYRASWAAAALKGAGHSLIYLGCFWLPLTVGFFVAQAARHLPPSILE